MGFLRGRKGPGAGRHGRAAPDGILPADRTWLVAGLDERDLSLAATEQRLQLMLQLIGDQSLEAAKRVLERILAAPAESDETGWLPLYAEFTYLRALQKPSDGQIVRRDELGREIVRRFADDPDLNRRGEALLIEATLQVVDGRTAGQWLQKARSRVDFETLSRSEQFRDGIELLERMVREEANGGPVGAPNEDFARITEVLRWWSEPGAALPARLGTAALPPAGAVEVAISDDSDAQEALVIAAHLAAQGRYGDAYVCIRSVAAFAKARGHDLALALATVIEGELLVLVDRVPEAVECLWNGSGELYRLGRLDTSMQAFLSLASLGASHPEVDGLLVDRVEIPDPSQLGARLLAIVYAARALAETIGDERGTWLADLIRARALFALGDHALAREAIVGLAAPPSGPSHDNWRLQALLAQARILLSTDGSAAAREALAQAERLSTAHHPWFAWQVDATRAEICHRESDLDGAWTASERALDALRSTRLLVGEERDRSAWSASRQSVWHEALMLARDRARPDHALAVIEDAKSTQLAKTIRAQLVTGSDPEAAGLLREAMSRLAEVPLPVGSRDQEVQRRTQEVVQRLRRADAQLGEVLEPPRLDDNSLARLREQFGRFLLIDFLDLGGDSIWRVMASDEGALDVRALVLDDRQQATLAKLDAAASAERVEEWIREADDRSSVSGLGRALLDGVPPVAECDTLLVSPSGRLGNVPWAMLECAGASVIDHFAVVLLQSIVLAEALVERTRDDGPPIMVCGDPELDGVARQRDRLRELWPELKVLERAGASTPALLAMSEAGELRAASSLVWAGHGEPHPDEPLVSGLHLADGSVMTAGVIAGLALPATIELWTCSSAAERRLPFDEQLGIVAACVRAGASSVLASLWPLDDYQVAELSGDYHERLRRGECPYAALRQVQLACRDRVLPSVWAAITLWGVTPRSLPPAASEPEPSTAEPTRPASVTVTSTPRWAPPVVSLTSSVGNADAVLQRAQAVAERSGWGYIGTGHLLWSLLHEETIGAALSDVGLFPVRVEGLLTQLPSFEPVSELGDTQPDGFSPLLQTVLDELGTASSANSILAAMLSRADGQARRIVEHCGVDPADVLSWSDGDSFPAIQHWKSYDPSTASLVEVGAEEIYEALCTNLPADLWHCESWPDRWLVLFGARLQDIQREKRGRLARSRLKTLVEHDKLRAGSAAGAATHRLMQLAMIHIGVDECDRVVGNWGAPKQSLAISAARTALTLAQVHGLVQLQARCHFLLGDMLCDRDERNTAIIHARIASELAQFIGDHTIEARAQIVLAHALVGDSPRSNLDLASSLDTYSQYYARAAEILRQAGERDGAHEILATLESFTHQ